MDRLIEATKARHANDADEERRYHTHVVHSLPLAGAAKEQIVKNGMAAVVAHLVARPDEAARISNLDDASQVKELSRIHAGESSGPEPHENEENDRQLGPKATRMRGHTRRQLVRV